jgi:PadR family transcriptional regulator PadR
MTLAMQHVLAVLLQDPVQPRYGFDVAKEAGLATGSLYPILARLERAGWLESWWEDSDKTAAGRPRRRYYRLTSTGAVKADDALASSRRWMFPVKPRPAAGPA